MGGSFGLGRVEDVDREERAWCKVLMLSGLLVIGSDSLDWTTNGGRRWKFLSLIEVGERSERLVVKGLPQEEGGGWGGPEEARKLAVWRSLADCLDSR